MTFDFALEYIPRRAKELGYENDYHLRVKHLSLGPSETRKIEAYNQLIIIVTVGNNLKVESDMGVIDLSDFNVAEHIYEHTGLITLTNKSNNSTSLEFIQVIPKNKISDAGNQ